MECGWPDRLGFSTLTPLDKFEAQTIVSHHSPGCIVYCLLPAKSVPLNKTTDRSLDNKIAEETFDFPCSSGGNESVRSF